MGGTCSTSIEEECVYVIGRKAGGKETLGRPRRRFEDNIKIDLGDIELGGVEVFTGLFWLSIGTRGALVNAAMNLGIP
jgi:hypothetical protein